MPVHLIILSDSHLFESPGKELFGVNTLNALRVLTGTIRQEGRFFDLLIACGDLSEDGRAESYRHFHRLSKGIARANIWLNGNHDDFSSIPVKLAPEYLHKEWHVGPWSLIFLDSTLPGKDEGYLEQDELDRLERFIRDHSEKFIFIFLHHQPVDVGSEFIDILGLQNKQAFWDIAGNHANVKAISFGHVHQLVDDNRHGISLFSNPSTAMQFKPHSRDLDFDEAAFAYRTVALNDDGSIEIQAIQIPG